MWGTHCELKAISAEFNFVGCKSEKKDSEKKVSESNHNKATTNSVNKDMRRQQTANRSTCEAGRGEAGDEWRLRPLTGKADVLMKINLINTLLAPRESRLTRVLDGDICAASSSTRIIYCLWQIANQIEHKYYLFSMSPAKKELSLLSINCSQLVACGLWLVALGLWIGKDHKSLWSASKGFHLKLKGSTRPSFHWLHCAIC